MSGVALHTIATAATTLIANIVESGERRSDAARSSIESQLMCLKQFIRALGQLEKSYCVTRRVRKIIQLVIRLSNLDLEQQPALPFVPPASMPSIPEMEMQQKSGVMQMLPPHSGANDVLGAPLMEMWDCPNDTSSFMMEDFLFPTMTQYDFLPLYESCYGTV